MKVKKILTNICHSTTRRCGSIIAISAALFFSSIAVNAASLAEFHVVDPEHAIPNQYIVLYKPQLTLQAQTTAAQEAIVSSTSYDIANNVNGELLLQYNSNVQGMVVKMDAAKVDELRKDPRVALVEQDQMMFANEVQNNATQGLDRVDQTNLPLNNTYVFDTRASNVTAFIVDTGIFAGHSNFGGRVGSGFTAINDGRGTSDCNGHGTHVAGTVGSATWGVAKGVTLIPVRVLACNGSGSNSGVIAGVNFVANNATPPAVANMSLGGGNSSALDTAVRNAVGRGVTFAVAAGNSNSDACVGSPNRVAEAITVASSTVGDSRSGFSNFGSCVDIFAPGSSITSTSNNGGTAVLSGTSMASPHVAGGAALILSQNPGASPSQVASALNSNASANKISGANGSPNRLLNTRPSGSQPPPPPPGGGSGSEPNLSAARGQWLDFDIVIPAGTARLTVQISGGSGDADLYVRRGALPTLSLFDCRPFLAGNSETCTINNPSAGTWFLSLQAFSSFSGVTLSWNFR